MVDDDDDLGEFGLAVDRPMTFEQLLDDEDRKNLDITFSVGSRATATLTWSASVTGHVVL